MYIKSSVQKGVEFDIGLENSALSWMKKLATSKKSSILSEYSKVHHLYEHDNALNLLVFANG